MTRNYKTIQYYMEGRVWFWKRLTRQGAYLFVWSVHIWPKTGWILLKQWDSWPSKWASFARIDFVFMKRAVRYSVAQIGNHTSKSEASIQSVTALNVGENSWTDWLEAEQRICDIFGYKNKFETKISVSRRRRIAKLWVRSQLLCQNYNSIANCKIDILRTMDPTLHYKMNARQPMMDLSQRLQIRRHQQRNRNRNRQLSMLIVNIETDAQTEWNQGTVDKFGYFSRWPDH